jgi:hypothetical protein
MKVTKEEERGLLIDWLDKYDEYEFLWTEESTLKELIEAKKTVQGMNKILEGAARKIKQLGKKNKKVGIGDTATDEAIMCQLYSLIH